mmetsp:Transcript_8081/g.23961  ORF Transcript_8081/g.23961 Transcript_8081/m.23961 type:complete len:419 (-) Transcript_8081:2-1258(-)
MAHRRCADATARELVAEHGVSRVSRRDLHHCLLPPLSEVSTRDRPDGPRVVGHSNDLLGRRAELPILEEEDEIVVRPGREDRVGAEREHRQRHAEDGLDPVAEHDVPDPAQGFALQRGGKETEEPLRAHEEEVEAVRAEGCVDWRQPLANHLLEHDSVRPELLHAVCVPTAGPQLHEELPQGEVRGGFVLERHDEGRRQEIHGLTIPQVLVPNCEATEDASQLVRPVGLLEGSVVGECPQHIRLDELIDPVRQDAKTPDHRDLDEARRTLGIPRRGRSHRARCLLRWQARRHRRRRGRPRLLRPADVLRLADRRLLGNRLFGRRVLCRRLRGRRRLLDHRCVLRHRLCNRRTLGRRLLICQATGICGNGTRKRPRGRDRPGRGVRGRSLPGRRLRRFVPLRLVVLWGTGASAAADRGA